MPKTTAGFDPGDFVVMTGRLSGSPPDPYRVPRPDGIRGRVAGRSGSGFVGWRTHKATSADHAIEPEVMGGGTAGRPAEEPPARYRGNYLFPGYLYTRILTLCQPDIRNRIS